MDTLQRIVTRRFTDISQKKQSKRLKNEDFFSDDEHEKQPNTMAFTSPLHNFPSSLNGSTFAKPPIEIEASARPPLPVVPKKPEYGTIGLDEIDKKFADQIIKQDETRLKRVNCCAQF